MKGLKSSILFLALAALAVSCTNKNIPSNGEYDDLYANSEDMVFTKQSSSAISRPPSDLSPVYDDEYDRLEGANDSQNTDEYYSDDYITTRDVQRKLSSRPGYRDGYSDGYSQGASDYNWSQPMGWNSPFNRFGGMGYGFNTWSPFRSGIFLSYNSFNSFGYGNNWGWNNPWAYSSFYSPWGSSYWMMDSWGYSSPWGYNSFYSPWGYNSYYSPWDNGYYGNQYANQSYRNYNAFGSSTAYSNKTRTYGAREGGRNSTAYNDGYKNTTRPSATNASTANTRKAVNTAPNQETQGQSRRLADRKTGSWVGNENSSNNSQSEYSRNSGTTRGDNATSAASYDPSTRRPSSYDSYNRSSNNVINSRNGQSTSVYGQSGSNNTRTYTPSNQSNTNVRTYQRQSNAGSTGSNSTRSYDSGSSSYSSGRSSNSSYSTPSSSSSSQSSSSGYSRGSSSSSSSSSGNTRGPR